jgi:hypothetical protein
MLRKQVSVPINGQPPLSQAWTSLPVSCEVLVEPYKVACRVMEACIVKGGLRVEKALQC